ncbi:MULTISPECIES: class I adenylate-forming enzyme family protein [unclassified Paracoccus (in: a-proteobacteria)]|uniref:class I adenylate-forming enzyme family protein n=1 Tax=unclassified Paracoccus (in: a-proteobacteria) TaxID=2688777 RepID=UPI0015FF3DF9|nr:MULTISPECIES: AMP-binding protein [unclassified Paracoccus (in: a-proteobacteria)]MBB1493005.1 AMP-binding protein [Paracoccus sp. MC1854]MBB1499551.1 AMP-binding protein [Paracoccus sp. MC1862]QQO45130.1 AMP-binding protein [Paracoccus sp. MC1862]
MRQLLTLGGLLDAQARMAPDRLGARDLERALTFGQWNARARRLANALTGLGLVKGDRVAVLAYNRLEWAEIYAACAKAGLIAVPINFRLAPIEIRFIIEDAGAACVVAEDSLYGMIEEVRSDLPIPTNRFIHFGTEAPPAGWQSYEDLIARASDSAPAVAVADSDPWALMYTSGTTGKPKGVIRSHRGMTLVSLVTQVELSIGRNDDALLVMPMCHANSLNFFCSFAHCGGVNTIYSRPSFDPEHALSVMEKIGSTFTSLVPTHYIMMLAAQTSGRNRDLGAMRKMMISSAPARADTKRAVMEMFPNSGLFELYGSSEAGWVTMLHPDEQFTNLGTVGRECIGSAPVRLLDDDGNEVPDGMAGELYSSTPYTFDGYWNQPGKTAEAFRGDYCTVGDMALRDEQGFIRLIDRKKNMIISGGENIYPSEIEAALGACPAVRDVAVIGLPDEKWGERVHAVVVLHDGVGISERELIGWCEDRIARFKLPRSVSFVSDDEIPRTATGKIQHRLLRDRLTERTAAA